VTSAGVVEPRPAATVVLLRPGGSGLEALLTHRPATMAFAGGAHVFPGGRVDASDADPRLAARSVVTAPDAAAALGGDLGPTAALAAHVAALRELFEEAGVLLADTAASAGRIGAGRTALLRGDVTFAGLAEDLDLRLRTDQLIALSRWVTPVPSTRRFDTRFFAAALPDAVEATFEGGEVEAHVWLRPSDALAAMADGLMVLWPPTSTTLQQLEHVTALEQIRASLAPGRLGEVIVERVSADVTRIVMPAGGGVAGQPVCAYLVGRRRLVLVDPGDPTGPALDRAMEVADEHDGSIAAVALTLVDPDHAAGSEAIAGRLGIPVVAGRGARRTVSAVSREVAGIETLGDADVPLRAVPTPGQRPDHLSYIVGDGTAVLSGDLDGVRGARSIVGPIDPVALAASRELLDRLAPSAHRLPGHPPV
jgi:glyoxylase-like metal-dependent hydrolase (beta-lactamase superfamily II)/8-oxo-dGTP pyrophosphatase MutT (NUDIX family)